MSDKPAKVADDFDDNELSRSAMLLATSYLSGAIALALFVCARAVEQIGYFGAAYTIALFILIVMFVWLAVISMVDAISVFAQHMND